MYTTYHLNCDNGPESEYCGMFFVGKLSILNFNEPKRKIFVHLCLAELGGFLRPKAKTAYMHVRGVAR